MFHPDGDWLEESKDEQDLHRSIDGMNDTMYTTQGLTSKLDELERKQNMVPSVETFSEDVRVKETGKRKRRICVYILIVILILLLGFAIWMAIVIWGLRKEVDNLTNENNKLTKRNKILVYDKKALKLEILQGWNIYSQLNDQFQHFRVNWDNQVTYLLNENQGLKRGIYEKANKIGQNNIPAPITNSGQNKELIINLKQQLNEANVDRFRYNDLQFNNLKLKRLIAHLLLQLSSFHEKLTKIHDDTKRLSNLGKYSVVDYLNNVQYILNKNFELNDMSKNMELREELIKKEKIIRLLEYQIIQFRSQNSRLKYILTKKNTENIAIYNKNMREIKELKNIIKNLKYTTNVERSEYISKKYIFEQRLSTKAIANKVIKLNLLKNLDMFFSMKLIFQEKLQFSITTTNSNKYEQNNNLDKIRNLYEKYLSTTNMQEKYESVLISLKNLKFQYSTDMSVHSLVINNKNIHLHSLNTALHLAKEYISDKLSNLFSMKLIFQEKLQFSITATNSNKYEQNNNLDKIRNLYEKYLSTTNMQEKYESVLISLKNLKFQYSTDMSVHSLVINNKNIHLHSLNTALHLAKEYISDKLSNLFSMKLIFQEKLQFSITATNSNKYEQNNNLDKIRNLYEKYLSTTNMQEKYESVLISLKNLKFQYSTDMSVHSLVINNKNIHLHSLNTALHLAKEYISDKLSNLFSMKLIFQEKLQFSITATNSNKYEQNNNLDKIRNLYEKYLSTTNMQEKYESVLISLKNLKFQYSTDMSVHSLVINNKYSFTFLKHRTSSSKRIYLR